MSLIPLITAWEKFIKINPEEDIQEFCLWILANKPEKKPAKEPINKVLENNRRAAILIAKLHKIMVIRTKPVLKLLGLFNEYEFSILYQVGNHKNANKKTICQKLMIEGSTGIEIIKRLIKNGLLIEKTDVKDKRSKSLALSPAGGQLIKKGYKLLSKVDLYQELLAPLSEREVGLFLDTLQKLNQFHKISASN